MARKVRTTRRPQAAKRFVEQRMVDIAVNSHLAAERIAAQKAQEAAHGWFSLVEGEGILSWA